ncbi:hypothetical protein GOP47_0001477 [Adiantum capillus-veneris]|uniref:RING-type E3 ubiquitin transferase n=1 Tax=Adiantum capillus-veneris TaxID=13818 RepID=A0A9D4V8F4_ADICA|nr:hypothetical protein GOP47_0001477 [Adiantum capillus-veneris]
MDRTEHQQSILTSDAVDSSPLLASSGEPSAGANSASRASLRRGRFSRIFRLLRRGNSRRIMREPSVLVRETAAEQLEERQSDWSYSRPVVVLDLIWNLAFITVALVVLILSRDERPKNPLRLWVVVYAAQCCIHMVCVWVEYRRRRQRNNRQYGPESSVPGPALSASERSQNDLDVVQMFEQTSSSDLSVFKRIESANTSFSFLWWVVGFYWTSTGSQSHDAPLLFWVCVAFLAFDVFFVVFCVSLACIIGVAVCCCLPCIIALMHAVAEQEGASEEDLNLLPKYKFRRLGGHPKAGPDMASPSGGTMSIIGTMPPGATAERVLPTEDSECCICLSTYEDGIELRELPCGHHFHCACVDRWLRMNSTCPLCKYNICKNSNNFAAEDV